MSHPVNDALFDSIRDLREAIMDLEALTLELQGEGNYAEAQDVYDELVKARIELNRLEGYFS